jgi:hypothetical protein
VFSPQRKVSKLSQNDSHVVEGGSESLIELGFVPNGFNGWDYEIFKNSHSSKIIKISGDYIFLEDIYGTEKPSKDLTTLWNFDFGGKISRGLLASLLSIIKLGNDSKEKK